MNISRLPEPVEIFIALPGNSKETEKENTSTQNLFLKPSEGKNNIRYHRFAVSSSDVLVTIKLTPEKGKTVDVFVNYKTKPTPQDNVFSISIPNFSYCSNATQNSSHSRICSSDPYTFTFSSQISNKTGIHYLGIRYTKNGLSRERRSCNPFHRRGKRSCVDVKDAPTTPAPTPRIIVPIYNYSTDVNYTLSISVTGCLYWSESKEMWTGEGCQVSQRLQKLAKFFLQNFKE